MLVDGFQDSLWTLLQQGSSIPASLLYVPTIQGVDSGPKIHDL